MQEAGVATTSQDMILAVTMGLPPTYDAVIINFDSTSPDQLTFENVVAWLINEETCQSSTEEAIKTEQNDAALAATHQHTGCDGCDHRCKLVCHFCKKPGHFKSECREKEKWEDWKNHNIANLAYSQAPEPDDEHAF
jgi:hypothetical protein